MFYKTIRSNTILFIFLVCLLTIGGCGKQVDKHMKIEFNNIRKSVVAGQFYPKDKNSLENKINNYLERAKDINLPDFKVRAVIAPHAGYDYSGQTAVYSYLALKNQEIDTVIIMCNSHDQYFSGIAIDDSDAWETPLGLVAVDKELANKLVEADKEIIFNSKVHLSDHVLEVQLPFLQSIIKNDFKIVPLLFGNAGDDIYGILAEALKKLLGSNDVVVVSTDLSHYPGYMDANKIDNKTLEIIKTKNIIALEEHIAGTLDDKILGEETLCCGIDGVKTIIELANKKDWQAKILKYANSGNALIGDKTRVVGYGAMVFGFGKEEAEEGELTKAQQEELLNIARVSVETYIRENRIPQFEIRDERLRRKEGAFVTLHEERKLRGCIGQITPSDKPLWQVVRDMAISAATEDHRFERVSKKDLTKINYEVSVLSIPKQINNWQNIELGKHGVIVKKDFHSGVFLPQVAIETGWDLDEFLSQLCFQKAGLAPDAYKTDSDLELLTFTAQVFDAE